jgi:PadR family transcriptional regulator PadR
MLRKGSGEGTRRGRGRGRRRRRVMQFLQPCLLLLLQRSEAHGYALLSELEHFGFKPEQLDPSLVYRALREMEQEGWIQSRWDDESQGPPRRVYALDQPGESQLVTWIEELGRTKSEIDRLLDAYKDQKDDHVG